MGLTTYLFLAVFLFGCGMALLRGPMFGVLTYVLVFYLSPADRWWGVEILAEIRWSLIAASVTAVSIAIHRPPRVNNAFASKGPLWALIAFTLWIFAQSWWAIDPKSHSELVAMYAKFTIALLIFCRVIQTDVQMKWFLWAHVIGCFYLGWLVFTRHLGGRFDDFGGPGLSDANAGALALVTAVLSAASLFLASSKRTRLAIVAVMPIIVNGIIATVSRSAFLGASAGAVLFNVFTPSRFRRNVRILSALGVVLALLLTNPMYWQRMASLKYTGSQVENVDTGEHVDTGEDRIQIMRAQWRMFLNNPMGCGHRCTATLSRYYLDERYLTGAEGEKARSSHNTFMTLLVEQGVFGALLYVATTAWLIVSIRRVWRRIKGQQTALASLLPAVVSVLAAITVGDLFVDFLKFEIRIWFISLLMIFIGITKRESEGSTAAPPSEVATVGNRSR